MENFTIQNEGVSPVGKIDEAIAFAKKAAVIEVFYSVDGPTKFLDPDKFEVFDRLTFVKNDSEPDPKTKFPAQTPRIDEILKIEGLLTSPDIQTTQTFADGSLGVNVKFKMNVGPLRAYLIENGLLICANGKPYPCTDASGEAVLAPTFRFYLDPKSFKFDPKLVGEVDEVYHLFSDHELKNVAFSVKPGIHLLLKDALNPQDLNGDNLPDGPFKVEVLEGKHKGAIGWTNYEVLEVLSDKQRNDWIELQVELRPEVQSYAGTEGVERSDPLTSVNPKKIHEHATHLVRPPANSTNFIKPGSVAPELGIALHKKPNGQIWVGNYIPYDTPVRVVESNLGSRLLWHKIRVLDPKLSQYYDITGKDKSKEYYVYAPYLRYLKGRYEYVNFTTNIKLVSDEDAGNSPLMEKKWKEEPPCKPWLQKDSRGFAHWEYRIVVEAPLGGDKNPKVEAWLRLMKYYDKEIRMYDAYRLMKNKRITKVVDTFQNPKISPAKVKWLIGVSAKYFAAIPNILAPFSFDYEARLDRHIDSGLLETKIKKLAEEITDVWEGLPSGTSPALGVAVPTTQAAAELQQKFNVLQAKLLALRNKDNPVVQGEVVVFSTTYKWRDLSKKIKNLKRVLKYYDKRIKKLKKPLDYVTIGLPNLDLGKEAAYLDDYVNALEGHLNLNDCRYDKGKLSKKDLKKFGTPASPGRDATIEFGFNAEFKPLYLLFNGKAMRLGWDCAKKEGPLSLPRSNALIHRADLVYREYRRKAKKKPPTAWVHEWIYPATIVFPSKVTTEGRDKKIKERLKALEVSTPTRGQLTEQRALLDDNSTHNIISKERSQAKNMAAKSDPLLSPRQIGAIGKAVNNIDTLYSALLDKSGLRPLVEELLECATKDMIDADKKIFEIILDPFMKDLEKQEDFERNFESTDDGETAEDLIVDMISAVGVECGKMILSRAFEIGSSEPKPSEAQAVPTGSVGINLNTPPPVPPQVEIQADFMIEGLDGVSPPYIALTENPEPALGQEINLDGTNKTYTVIYENPTYSSKTIGVVNNHTKISVDGVSGDFFKFRVPGTKVKGYVLTKYVKKTVAGALGFLKDGTQLNRVYASDNKTPYEDKKSGFWKVKIIVPIQWHGNGNAQANNNSLKDKVGWIPSAYLRPKTDKAKKELSDSEILLKPGSRDKKNGLFNELYIWQTFLATAPIENPNPTEATGSCVLENHYAGGVADLAGIPKKWWGKPKKYFGKNEYPGRDFGKDTIKATIKYFQQVEKKKGGKNWAELQKDFLTNADFAPVRAWAQLFETQKFEKALDKIEEDISLPKPLTVLGNLTYAPPGFYIGRRSKCDWYYVAVVKMATRVASLEMSIEKKSTKKKKRKLKKLKRKLKKWYLKYSACMDGKQVRVYGPERTFIATDDADADELIQGDSYLMVNASEKCKEKYDALVKSLNGEETWPGMGNATDAQRCAFSEWTTCLKTNAKINEEKLKAAAKAATPTEAAKKIKKLKTEAATKPELDTVDKYSSFPTDIDGFFDHLIKHNTFPNNIRLKENAAREIVAGFSSNMACKGAMDKALAVLLAYAEEEKPATFGIVVAVIKAASLVGTSLLSSPKYKPFTMPKKPTLGVDQTGNDSKNELSAAFKKVAREVIVNTIIELTKAISHYCSQAQDGANSEPKSLEDPFNDITGEMSDKINQLASAYGIDPKQVQDQIKAAALPAYNQNGPSGFSFLQFIKDITALLTKQQKCMLLNNNAPPSLMEYIRERAVSLYPEMADFFQQDNNISTLFEQISLILDPDVCEPTSDKDPYNIPENTVLLDGDCPADYFEGKRRKELEKSGLPPTEAKKQYDKEFEERLQDIVAASKLLDDPEKVIRENTPDPCDELNELFRNDPLVNNAINTSLDATFSDIALSFNDEASSFLPALTFREQYGAADIIPEDILDKDGNIKVDAYEKMLAKAHQSGQEDDYQKSTNAFSGKLETVKKVGLATIKTVNIAGKEVSTFLFDKPLKDENGKPRHWDTAIKAVNWAQSNDPHYKKRFYDSWKNADLEKYDGNPAQAGIDACLQGIVELQIPKTITAQDFKDITGQIAPRVSATLRHSKAITAHTPSGEEGEENNNLIKEYHYRIGQGLNSVLVYSPSETGDGNTDTFNVTMRGAKKNAQGKLVQTNAVRLAGRRQLRKDVQDYMTFLGYKKQTYGAATQTSNQQKFFSFYGKEKVRGAFGSIKNPEFLDNVSNNLSKAMDIEYSAIAEQTQHAMLNLVADSKLFRREILASININPSFEEYAKNCSVENADVPYGNSLLNLQDLKDQALADYFDTYNICDDAADPGEIDPLNKVQANALLMMFIRVHMIENALNGMFAFTSFKMKDIMGETIMKLFLFKTLKDDLLKLRLYSKFKDLAKDIVLRRKQKGVNLTGIVSGAECLKYLFGEQYDIVTRQFETIFKVKTKNIDRVFLDNVAGKKILEVASETKTNDQYAPGPVSKHNRFYVGSMSADSALPDRTVNKDGGFFLERYIKIIDMFDDDGHSTFDKSIQNFDGTLKNYFNEVDGKWVRKDYLKGFVRLHDWYEFVSAMKEASNNLKKYQVATNPLTPANGYAQTKKVLDSILYESSWHNWFDEVSFGIRLVYALPEQKEEFASQYREQIDKLMSIDPQTADVEYPSGGVTSFRNIEKVKGIEGASPDTWQATYLIPMAKAEVPVSGFQFTDPGFVKLSLFAQSSKDPTKGNGTLWMFEKEINKIKNKLISDPEYRAVTEFLFPIKRYASLASVYTITLTKSTLPVTDFFMTTKFLIKAAFDLNMGGMDHEYEDYAMKLKEAAFDGIGSTDPESPDFDPFAAMILKIILKTPFLILKGVTEIVDPNIAITKKIYDGINLIMQTANENIIKKLKKDYDEFKTKKEKVIQEAKDSGAPEPPPVPSFEEWAEQKGIDIPNPSIQMDPAMGAMIAISMLPSALPYGVGFPPLPLGPGIGPPMTPFAIPYLTMGMISDGFLNFKKEKTQDSKVREPCADPINAVAGYLPPPEEDNDNDDEIYEDEV